MPAPLAVQAAIALGPKILDLISEVVLDKDQAKELSHEITKTVTDNAHAIALEQIRTNRQEAKHRSLLVAGWRPGLGWLSVAALGVNYLGIPLANIYLKLSGSAVQVDQMDTGPLLSLVTLMLGFGGLRTYEKRQGLTK